MQKKQTKLKTSEIVTQPIASEYHHEEINNILSEDKIGWENSPTNISKIIKQKMTTSPNDKTIKKIKKWVTSQPEYEDGKYKVMTLESPLPTETPLLSRKPSLERTLSEMSYGSSPEAPDYYPVFLEFMQKYSKDIQENLTELGSTELESSKKILKRVLRILFKRLIRMVHNLQKLTDNKYLMQFEIFHF